MKIIRQLIILTFILLGAVGVIGCERTQEGEGDASLPAVRELTGDSLRDSYVRQRNQRITRYGTQTEEIHISDDSLPGSKKDYTIMIYMIGSDLESKYGAASDDLEEIQDSGVDFSKTNIIAYAGGANRWNTNILSSVNSVIDLSRPSDSWVTASTKKPSNMGDAGNLTNFINFCRENYPAEHTALIFWDHGGGPLLGYGSDELSSDDGLLLSELKLAMEEAGYGENNKLDWVGFDACLMSNYENIRLWSEYADYFVGSEEVEPQDGWDYSFLNILNKKRESSEIVTKIIDCYEKYYNEKANEKYDPDITLAAFDLSKFDNLENALEELLSRLTEDVDADYLRLQQSRADTKSFGRGVDAEGREYYYDLIDLGSFEEQITQNFSWEDRKLRKSILDMTIRSCSNIENAQGISIYYPFSNKELYMAMNDLYEDLDESAYAPFLSSVADRWIEAEVKDWDIELKREGEVLTAQLTEDQLKKSTSIYYNLLVKWEEDEDIYDAVILHSRVQPSEKGSVQIPTDQEMFYVSNESDTGIYLPVKEVERSDQFVTYETYYSYLDTFAPGQYMALAEDTHVEHIKLSATKRLEDSLVRIDSITASDQSLQTVGKSTIEIENYERINTSTLGMVPGKRENGSYLSYTEWESAGVITTSFLSSDDTLSAEARDISRSPEHYYIQLVLEDENGIAYGSAPVSVTDEENLNLVTMETEKGKLTFHLEDGAAELIEYEGEDETLVIPDTVEEQPVIGIGEALDTSRTLKEIILPKNLTELNSNAFRGCRALEEIEIPPGVKVLGKGLFMNCSALRSVRIPGTVEKLGAGIFAGCSNLQQVEFYGKNQGEYIIENNCILTGDGKIMLSMVDFTVERLEIPEKVERIAYGAAAGAENLKEVTLPETLIRIDNSGFYNCTSLRVTKFPEKLEYIGSHAFDQTDLFIDQEFETMNIETIEFGKNLSYIGDRAFARYFPRKFEVDDDNPHFSSREGTLTNKAGDSVVEYAILKPYELIIPEGIRVLDIESLSFLHFLHETENIYLPDSIDRITNAGEAEGYSLKENVVLYCGENSVILEFAKEYGIPVEEF